jgi:hypothetical protein
MSSTAAAASSNPALGALRVTLAWASLIATLIMAPTVHADVLRVPKHFASIQEAVDAAQAGDTVLVSAGTYHETLEIFDKQDVTVRGLGKVLLEVGGLEGTGVVLDTCFGVSLERLRILEADTDGVRVLASAECELDRLVIERPGHNGVLVDHDSVDVVVRRCDFIDVPNDGVVAEGDETLIERNTFSEFGWVPIRMTGSGCIARRHRLDGEAGILALGNENLVERNRIRECPGVAIVLGDGGLGLGSKALRNRIDHPWIDGIRVGGSGALVERNAVADAEGRGIRLTGPLGDHRVVLNTVRGGDVAAIAVMAESPFNVVDKNLIRGTHGMGLKIMAPQTQVLANRVRDADTVGIFVAGDDGLVQGNVVTRAGSTGMKVKATGGTYEANVIKHADEHGIHVMEPGNVLRANRVRLSGVIGLLDEAGDNTYEDNDFDSIDVGS